MPLTPEGRRLRARVAILSRFHPDQPELVDARRDLKADSAEEYIRQLVDSWPPLSEAQRGRLAALLGGATDQDRGDGDAEAP